MKFLLCFSTRFIASCGATMSSSSVLLPSPSRFVRRRCHRMIHASNNERIFPGKRTQEKTSPPTFMEEVSKAFTTEEEFFPFFKTLLGHIAENKLPSKALLLNRKISSKFPRFLLFFCAPLSLLLAEIWRDGI